MQCLPGPCMCTALALAPTSAAPAFATNSISVAPTLENGSNIVPVSGSNPLTLVSVPVISADVEFLPITTSVCETVPPVSHSGNEFTSFSTSLEGLPNVESIQHIPLPTDLENPSAQHTRRASHVIQTNYNPVEVAFLYEKLEANITFVEHHHEFLTECIQQQIVPKGLWVDKSVHLRLHYLSIASIVIGQLFGQLELCLLQLCRKY